MGKVDLSTYNNNWYQPGPAIKRLSWYLVNIIFFRSGFFPLYGLKRGLLRAFGAKVGHGVLIKPFVNIKYPWFLEIGDHVWIGERAWIDNLALVVLRNNVCISQGAYLLTGNHDYRSPAFDLQASPVLLQEGVWIGAFAIVCPGVTCETHAVLAVNSVATHHLEAYGIYQGNPAVLVKKREIGAVERLNS